MNEDRELMELAAQAAGLQEWGWMANTLTHVVNNQFVSWEPLTDDGDALRLAVKLKIDVKHYEDHVVGWFDGGYIGTGKIPYNDDPQAATRRAIVRAAAAIGETM